MDEPPLTDIQRAFLHLMHAPTTSNGTRLIRLVHAIEEAAESERVGLLTVFLRASSMPDQPGPKLEEKLSHPEEELSRTESTYLSCIEDGTVEIRSPFERGAPIEEAAAHILRQLELLRPYGILTQAWLLHYLMKSGLLPYDSAPRIESVERSAEEVWDILAHRPQLYASIARLIIAHVGEPYRLSSAIRQLLAGQPREVQDVFLGGAFEAYPSLVAMLRRQKLLSMLTREPESGDALERAEYEAWMMDPADKSKMD